MMRNLILRKSLMTFTESSIPKSIKSTILKKKNLTPFSSIILLRVKRLAMFPRISSKESDFAKLCWLRIRPNNRRPRGLPSFKRLKFPPVSKTNQCPLEAKHNRTKSLSSFQFSTDSLLTIFQSFWKRVTLVNHSFPRSKWENTNK